ncbi:hypothetical protein [Atribacter laminatus]|uniref:Uncharacterized protein n=1 Tax=Atribacter laminatus TaxID=2847778 RepID=A0A7T1AP86_ATRLM|nr:hypothetical protein [Atribacter laminatus]QPM69544.1 hypothetical protein RT761_02777 [Atribacter laminatus]
MKSKIIFLITIILVFSIHFIASSQDMFNDAINFESLKHQKYFIRQEDKNGITEGSLTVDVVPQNDDKYQVNIDFLLGEDHFTNAFVASKNDSQNLFNNLFFSNPMTMAVVMPVFAVQFMLLPVTLMGGELKEGFLWTSKEDDEELTIQVPSSEERFGFKAYWVEILKDKQMAVRMLYSKEAPLPFVVEIMDSDTLDEGLKSLYLELQEWETN